VKRLATLLAATMIAGCSTLGPPIPDEPERPTPGSGPPAQPTPPAPPAVPAPPRDLAAIPDAVPRTEPRSRYGNPPSYEVFGRRYTLLPTAAGHVERGPASWYGPGFHAERTSSGEPYDMYAMTAAHKTLPIPAYARVTNLRNGRSVVVRINDRGPFVGDRIIDLSYTAAWKLNMLREGTAPVEVRVIEPAAPTPATTQAVAFDLPGTPAGAPEPPIVSQWLQAGSFTSAGNAQALVSRLAGAGIRNAVVREGLSAGRPVFRVRVGPIAGALELDDMVERLRLAGVPDARLAHD
jgi:rare lipoprotein A